MNFYKHYIGDFQRDTGHLSLTERGAYLCLMHHYYATEKPLPNDHTALCRIAGAQDKSERDAVRAVMAFFEPCTSGLMHKRIEAELHKAGQVANTNREIAIAREAARRAAREEHEQSTKRALSVQRTSDEQSTNQTPDTRKEPPNPRRRGQVSEFPPGFDRFWEVYPRKQAKPAAAKAFARLRADDALLARMLAAIAQQAFSEQWRKDGGRFIPLPASWINGQRWEDSPVGLVSGSDIFAGAE